jgi:hypothetical protein
MKAILERVVVLVLAVSIAPIALADSGDEIDEATITVVDEGSTPEDVVKVIELPDRASATAATKSASGLDTANKSGQSGRDLGQQVSEDARNGNLGDQVRADTAQQVRGDSAAGNRHNTPSH